MLRDTERMQAHIVFNIRVMVFRYSAMCFILFIGVCSMFIVQIGHKLQPFYKPIYFFMQF